MISKKIHYIWFGKGEKPNSFNKYLESWKKFCPDYEIIEWNEENYDINKNEYLLTQYNKKEFAFASDYARFDILYNHGGIYLDIDVEVYKNFDPLLQNPGFTGYQDEFYIGGSVIGAEKYNPVIKKVLDLYDTKKNKIIITHIFKNALKKFGLKDTNGKIQKLKHFTVYPKDYFYPYAFFQDETESNITTNTYTAHHFNASWLPGFIMKPTKFFFKFLHKCKKLLYN